MKVRIDNQTTIPTRVLRRFFVAGIRAAGLNPDGYYVKVVWAKRRHSGCAYYDSRWVTMRAPSKVERFDVASFARVFDHELAHNRGVRHDEMDPATLWCSGPCPEWAADFKADDFFPPAKPKAPRAERLAALVDARAERAEAAAVRWERKARAAAKLAKKWRAKVRYYTKARELKAAASKPEAAPEASS